MRDVEAALASRWPESRIAPSLERIGDLTTVLGDPQATFPVIHIGGTNGKTSTARMIDELLRGLGLRTGRYTSPHLESVTERIALDGSPVDPELFAATYAELSPYLAVVDARHEVQLSFFEVLTAMAFATFADAPVNVGVVEVGMGGAWDATNVVDGKIAVLLPISIDHAEYLGDSVGEIAAEKAGIIKTESVAVLAEQPPDALPQLQHRALEAGASVVREGMDFGVRKREVAVGGQLLSLGGLAGSYDDVFLPLHGAHQAQNAVCALAAVEAFFGGDRASLDTDLVRAAFAGVGSPGRLEVLRRSPTIMVDAAHNPASARALANALREEFTFASLVAVVAVLRDKDVVGILEALAPVVDAVVVTHNSSPRVLPAADLVRHAVTVVGERTYRADALPDAIDLAVQIAERDSVAGGAGVVVTGSVVTAGDARRLLRSHR
ncbi:MAG: bifunctional folylpolyglutamate synthase/dihydrofolate synthase [Jiangellaceae bacterium]|nr:bifunctional folylpolyglutamate synthase/dihydrofolate synthase [Jiangellaceae bacterium]